MSTNGFVFWKFSASTGGLLNAGIGAGANVAIAGGSFAAGFVGTATVVSPTGFVAGALTGLASGGTSGLILGTGNTLVENQSFGKALWTGFEQMWKQGAIGALTGGIMSGINAANKGRNFITGSYRTYKLPLNQIASTNNGALFEQYSVPDNATIANMDSYNVYFKPEEGVYGIDDVVRPGGYHYEAIDGVATSKYTEAVFKIPNRGRVKVLPGGDVEFTSGLRYDIAKIVGYKSGWKDAQYFISKGAYYSDVAKEIYGWDILFKMALRIK